MPTWVFPQFILPTEYRKPFLLKQFHQEEELLSHALKVDYKCFFSFLHTLQLVLAWTSSPRLVFIICTKTIFSFLDGCFQIGMNSGIFFESKSDYDVFPFFGSSQRYDIFSETKQF